MAKQLGRWRGTDTPPIGARPGAYVTSPVVDAAPASPRRQPARHVHVYLPATATTPGQARARTRDAAPAPARFPIADGDTFSVSDCGDDGFALRRVRSGDTNPDGMPTPDNVFGQSDPPGAAALDALRRRMAPRQVNDRARPQLERDQIRATQDYLNAIWAPRS